MGMDPMANMYGRAQRLSQDKLLDEAEWLNRLGVDEHSA